MSVSEMSSVFLVNSIQGPPSHSDSRMKWRRIMKYQIIVFPTTKIEKKLRHSFMENNRYINRKRDCRILARNPTRRNAASGTIGSL